jgi:flagellar biosynthesis/type III secretory pathway protein FliH
MADENGTTPEQPQTPETGAGEGTGAPAAERPKETGETKIPPEVERALRKANKEAETLRLKLKEYEDRDKSEADKLAEGKAEAEREAATAKRELMRYRVAAKKKLPAELANRLQGSTEEEMESDADNLLEVFGAQQRQTPSYDGGVRQTARPTSMNDLIRHTAGLG